MSKDREEAQDLFQETFRRVHEKAIRLPTVHLRTGCLRLRPTWLSTAYAGANVCDWYR
jgi:hypothetical protein